MTPSACSMGGSAGSLLAGAVMNMRPELWNADRGRGAFVDVVNTMLDESIPLTTGEFDEWGDPKEKMRLRAYAELLAVRQCEGCEVPSDARFPGLHDEPGAVLGSPPNGYSAHANTNKGKSPLS
ncbi:MAG: prolyl oligopeptidase family serine peptidase [Flavobacteriales bacterium]|nr:prolyl oligopeptidase family serine peptidase [Flavobacteriales bacterium]